MSAVAEDEGSRDDPDLDSYTPQRREAWARSPDPVEAERRRTVVAAWEEKERARVERVLARSSGTAPVDAAAATAADSLDPDNPPFVVLTRADIRAMPRVGWLIGGLVQTSGLVILAGNGGVGKSAVALDWSASIASARDWHGRKVRGGNVLYIAGEGVEGIEERLVAWESVTGVAIPEERLEFVAENFSLANKAAVDYAREVVKERHYSLVVLDTLSQLAGLENENDNAEMSRVMAQAKAIRQARPGTTVLIVHHSSKAGGVRGASTLRNNADAVIVALADTSGVGFHLTTENTSDGKQKNGAAERLDGFWLDEAAGSVVVRRGGQTVQDILNLMADGAEYSGNDIWAGVNALATAAEKKAIMRTVGDLVASGKLTHNGGKTTAARWRLGQT